MNKPTKITQTSFRFIGVDDTGPESGARCPHCGAEGRYIYHWEENGEHRAAMAGCYKVLTGHLKKGDFDEYFQLLSEKQAKGKKLNSWDQSVIRLLKFRESGKYPVEWCDRKITETIKERARWLREHHR